MKQRSVVSNESTVKMGTKTCNFVPSAHKKEKPAPNQNGFYKFFDSVRLKKAYRYRNSFLLTYFAFDFTPYTFTFLPPAAMDL